MYSKIKGQGKFYCTFNWRFSHYFQCSLVGINFLARTVPHTLSEMFLEPQHVHGGCSIFRKKKVTGFDQNLSYPTYLLYIQLAFQSLFSIQVGIKFLATTVYYTFFNVFQARIRCGWWLLHFLKVKIITHPYKEMDSL